MLPLSRHARIAFGVLAYLVFAYVVICPVIFYEDIDTLESHALGALDGGRYAMYGLEFAEAEKHYRLGVDFVRANEGSRRAEESSAYAEGFEGWGDALKAQGRYAEAVKRYERAVAIYEKADGPLATSLIGPLYGLKQIHREMGRDSLADACDARIDSVALFHARVVEKEVGHLRRSKGGNGATLADRLVSLGDLYGAAGHLCRAEAAYLEAQEIRRRAFGPRSDDAAMAQHKRGWVAALMGKNAVAKTMLDSSLALHEGSFGRDNPKLVPEMSMLGALALDLSRYDEADSIFARSLAALEARIGRDQHWSLPTMERVADTRAALGRLGEAKAMWKRIHGVHRRAHGEASYPAGTDLLKIAELEERSGDVPRARETCQEALHVLIRAVGPRHPSVIEARYYLSELDRSVEEAVGNEVEEEASRPSGPAQSEPQNTPQTAPENAPASDPDDLRLG